jgi:hypothetical protein
MAAFDEKRLRIVCGTRRFALATLILAMASCTVSLPPRECDEDSDCLSGGVGGTCLPSPSSAASWCAFPVDTGMCASGLIWGLRAGDGLMDSCVEDLPMEDGGPGNDGAVLDGGPDARPPCAWTPPQLVLNVNTGLFEYGAASTEDGLTLVFTRLLGEFDSDILVASRGATTASFGPPSPLPNVNTVAVFDETPELSYTALEIFFRRAVPENPGAIWTSVRSSAAVNFAAPTSLGVDGHSPSISGDGLTLYYVDVVNGKVKAASRSTIGGLWSPSYEVMSTPYRTIDVSGDERRILLSGVVSGSPMPPVAIAERDDPMADFGAPVPVDVFSVTGDGNSSKNASWAEGDRTIYLELELPSGPGASDIYVSTCQ